MLLNERFKVFVEEFACSSDVLMQQFFVILNIPVGASAC